MNFLRADQPFFQKPQLKSSLAERILLGALILIHLLVMYSVVRSANPLIWPLHNDTIHRSGRASDFYAIYHAAVNLEEGISPYEINEDGITPYFYQFRYLPVVAQAGRVFTHTTPYRAYFLWALFLEGLLGLQVYYLWTRMDQAWYRLAVVGLLLINSPYFLEVYMGQFTFATVTLCFLSLVLPLGFLWLSASIILKPITLAVVPALVRKKSTFFSVLAAGLLMILTSLPLFLSHADQWQDFFALNFSDTGGGLHSGNYSLVYLLWQMANDLKLSTLLEHWESVFGILRLVVLTVVALLVLHSRGSMRGGIAALLLAHFVSYPHVWEHHHSAVIVIAAMLMMLPEAKAYRLPVLISMIVLALPTPFVFFDTVKDAAIFDPTLTWPRYAVYAILLPKVIPTLYLFVLSIRQVRKAGFFPTKQVLLHWLSNDSENPISI